MVFREQSSQVNKCHKKNKVLLLTSRSPFPLIGGDKLRFFHILKYLSTTSDISIIYFSDQVVDQSLFDRYRDYFSEIQGVVLPKSRSYINCILGLFKGQPLQVSYYRSRKMAKLIKKKISETKFDLIWVHLIRMSEYVKNCSQYKILDMTDAQSLNYLRSKFYRSGLWSVINSIERSFVRKYEQGVWKHFNKTYVVSHIDQRYLKNLDSDMGVEVLSNGVDIDRYKFRMNTHSNKKISFIGNMRTFPNTDAAVWFGHEIFPIIKERIQDVKFYVIGTEPSKKVKQLSKIRDIIVTDEVDDICQYVYDASVSVAPMRVGAGIQNKILESMALGTPVVSTSISIEGITCTPGRDVLIADSPRDFADQVIKLLEDRVLKTRISKNARKNVEENYTWEKMLKKIDTVIDKINKNKSR